MLSGVLPGISSKEKETVLKYLSGMTYNQKDAARFKQSNNLSCPICSCQDSALHILSGCQPASHHKEHGDQTPSYCRQTYHKSH